MATPEEIARIEAAKAEQRRIREQTDRIKAMIEAQRKDKDKKG